MRSAATANVAADLLDDPRMNVAAHSTDGRATYEHGTVLTVDVTL
jgi:hypothetical protein